MLEELSALLRGALEDRAAGSETTRPMPADAEASPSDEAVVPTSATKQEPVEPPVVLAPKPITGPRLAPEYLRTILNQGLGNAITREPTAMPMPVSDRAPVVDVLDRVVLARRFDVKARCCAFLMERDAASKRGESLWNFQKDRYEAIKGDAAACDARLWMLRAWEDGVEADYAEMLINGFKNLAQAMELIEEDDPASEVLELVAEAQSAVRALCEDQDADQTRVFMWLRQQTDRRRIFLKRHMADSTRADPAIWADLRERITMALQKRRVDAERDRALKKPLQRAAFHAKKIETAFGRGLLAEAEDWSAIERAMKMFTQAGGSLESNVWLDAIAAAAGVAASAQATELSASLSAGLRESLARAAARADEGEDEESSLRGWERNPAPELAKLRAFLRGREIVLVGGSRRPLAEEAIIEAFELSGIRWLDFGEHKSLELFKPDVTRPEVVLVLAMIRFMSHAYDDLREVCQRHGKLYARLKGGYSPNQIEGSQRLAE